MAVPGTFICGLQSKGSGAWKSPTGELGGQRPREAEAICRHCLHILMAETIKMCEFRKIRLTILDQYVSWWGGYFGGLAPSPFLAPALDIKPNYCTNLSWRTYYYSTQSSPAVHVALASVLPIQIIKPELRLKFIRPLTSANNSV